MPRHTKNFRCSAFLEHLMKAFMGSNAVNNIKIRDSEVVPTSANSVLRLIDGLSTKVFPRFSYTKSTEAKMTFPSLKPSNTKL